MICDVEYHKWLHKHDKILYAERAPTLAELLREDTIRIYARNFKLKDLSKPERLMPHLVKAISTYHGCTEFCEWEFEVFSNNKDKIILKFHTGREYEITVKLTKDVDIIH